VKHFYCKRQSYINLIVTNGNPFFAKKKTFDANTLKWMKFYLIFQIHSKSENAREANEMYDAIKEGGSTRPFNASLSIKLFRLRKNL
jgi:hypothetical protein